MWAGRPLGAPCQGTLRLTTSTRHIAYLSKETLCNEGSGRKSEDHTHEKTSIDSLYVSPNMISGAIHGRCATRATGAAGQSSAGRGRRDRREAGDKAARGLGACTGRRDCTPLALEPRKRESVAQLKPDAFSYICSTAARAGLASRDCAPPAGPLPSPSRCAALVLAR